MIMHEQYAGYKSSNAKCDGAEVNRREESRLRCRANAFRIMILVTDDVETFSIGWTVAGRSGWCRAPLLAAAQNKPLPENNIMVISFSAPLGESLADET